MITREEAFPSTCQNGCTGRTTQVCRNNEGLTLQSRNNEVFTFPIPSHKRQEREWDNKLEHSPALSSHKVEPPNFSTSYPLWQCPSLTTACPPSSPATETKSFAVHPFSGTLVHFVAPPQTHDSTFVISQSSDSEMDMGDDDNEMQSLVSGHFSSNFIQDKYAERRFKRSRKDDFTFPMLPVSSEPFEPQSRTKNGKLEWWKQKRKSQSNQQQLSHHCSGAMKSENEESMQTDSVCFVCQNPLQSFRSCVDTNNKKDPTSHTVHAVTNKNVGTKQKNSLLAYFHTSSKFQPAQSSSIPTQPNFSMNDLDPSENLPSCTYCDRFVCTRCTRTCERCSGRFCTFCSTINYDGPTERTFCLDCEQGSME